MQRACQPTQQDRKKTHLSGHPHCQWKQDCQTAAQKRQAASPSMTRAPQALRLEAPSSLLLGTARVSQARRRKVETLLGCAGCASPLWVITPTSASARSPRPKGEKEPAATLSRTTAIVHARPGAREMVRTKAAPQAAGQGGHLHHAHIGCQIASLEPRIHTRRTQVRTSAWTSTGQIRSAVAEDARGATIAPG